MPRRNLVWLCGIGLISLFCWTIAQGGIATPHGPLQFIKGFPGSNLDYERMSLLVDVMQHVEQSYVHELSQEDRRKFMENALQGGLQSLDLHSAYIAPKEYKQFMKTNQGKFGGIGVQISTARDTKRLTVITPIVGTPAYKAGIKPGDEIVRIEGKPTDGMTTDEAVDMIQGMPGTKINLSVRQRGAERERELTLVRSLIEVESVLSDLRGKDKNWDFVIDKQNHIAYIRLVQFTSKSVGELTAVLHKLEQQGVRGLVLDLRNNPGGLLDAAVEIGDMFLTQGKIVSVEGRNRPAQSYEAHEDGTFLLPVAQHPMAVLINEGSASASEIVAAALQDHNRAVIVGERSYGKGSVQNLIPMESGKSALKLTTAKYLRPSGKNIHRFPDSKEDAEWGVKPDIEVKLNPQDELEYWLARRDRDIVRDDGVPTELVSKLADVLGAIGSGWTTGDANALVQTSGQFIHALHVVSKTRKPYADKVLDRALEHIREKLKG